MLDKRIEWSEEKNKRLIEMRNVCFEQIFDIISSEKVIYVINHPNKHKYPNQKLMFVNINKYIYYVPFVED
ncbi:MAG TPA: toxin [Spirochaetia bacterium]|nr:toxin [Spirochaetia bacterium]